MTEVDGGEDALLAPVVDADFDGLGHGIDVGGAWVGDRVADGRALREDLDVEGGSVLDAWGDGLVLAVHELEDEEDVELVLAGGEGVGADVLGACVPVTAGGLAAVGPAVLSFGAGLGNFLEGEEGSPLG